MRVREHSETPHPAPLFGRWIWGPGLLGLLLLAAACQAVPQTDSRSAPRSAPRSTTQSTSESTSQSTSESRGEILKALPDDIDPSLHYVIYLHGAIVEGTDRRPTHPRFGPYEYDAILQALSTSGRVVVSAQRPERADVEVWASRTAAQVDRLIAAGVPPAEITVVGFSKGGVIAILASSRETDPQVRYVLMGACGAWLSRREDVRLHGRVLSLVEDSDTIGRSCQPLFDRSPDADTRQIVLHTGLEHGTFYRPRPVWLTPARAWIDADGTKETSHDPATSQN